MKINCLFLVFLSILLFVSTGFGEERKIYSVGGEVKPPKAIRTPMPPDTEEAKRAQIKGIIRLEGVITAEGNIIDVKITKGLGYGLDESAVETLTKDWLFEPATYQGQPVNVKSYFEVSFNEASSNLVDKALPTKELVQREPVQVDSVRFTGNRLFTEDQLRAALHEKLNAFSIIRADDIDKAVRALYHAYGYIEVNVKRLPNGILCIHEGKEFHIGKLQILNAKIFPVDYLLSLLEVKEGDILDSFKLRVGLEKIQRLYTSVGLLGWHYNYEEAPRQDEGELDITFTFFEE